MEPFCFVRAEADELIDNMSYAVPGSQSSDALPFDFEKYGLLLYVITYWKSHTRVSNAPTLDRKLQDLDLSRTLSFEFRPWGPNTHFGRDGCKSCPSPSNCKSLPLVSLFHYTAEVGNIRLMKLANGSSEHPLLKTYTYHGRYTDEALMVACRFGQLNMLKYLLEVIDYDVSNGKAVNAAAGFGHDVVLGYLQGLGNYRVWANTTLAEKATSL